MMVALLEAGWIPVKPNMWLPASRKQEEFPGRPKCRESAIAAKNMSRDEWHFGFLKLQMEDCNELIDDLREDIAIRNWAAAATYEDGAGVEQGVDMREGFEQSVPANLRHTARLRTPGHTVTSTRYAVATQSGILAASWCSALLERWVAG